MAPAAANGQKQKANLGVLSHTMQGFIDYIANMPEVRGYEYPFTCTSIQITVSLLQHTSRRFLKALHSIKALPFENKTKHLLVLVQFFKQNSLNYLLWLLYFLLLPNLNCLTMAVGCLLVHRPVLLFSHRYRQK